MPPRCLLVAELPFNRESKVIANPFPIELWTKCTAVLTFFAIVATLFSLLYRLLVVASIVVCHRVAKF